MVAEYDASRRDCAKTFQVTACNDHARTLRDARLNALRQEQIALDEQRRQQRSAERLRVLQDRAAQSQARSAQTQAKAVSAPESGQHGAAAANAAAPGAASASAAAGKPPAESMHRRSAAPAAAASKSASESAAQVAAREAARRERYQRRVDEAERHRAEVQSRNAEQSARKPAAAGLPVPGASAASSPSPRGP